jgi:hypothetical protein
MRLRANFLKEVVGANGFEPSTSWSRTRRASQAALRPDMGHTKTKNALVAGKKKDSTRGFDRQLL